MLGAVRLIPGGQGTIEPALRNLRLKFRRWAWAKQARSGEVVAGTNLLTLNPATIEFCPTTEFAYNNYKGRTESGNWDQSDKRFEQLAVYQAFDQVCKQKNAPWQETAYYQDILKTIESGEEMYSCKSVADLDARCESLSALYDSIEKAGYKSQAELENNLEDEVAVAISRDGQILFSDGAHRLSIAKLLDVKEIPVLVAVRHPEWSAFKAQLLGFAKTQALGGLYQQALHPDLLSVPASHGCSDRFDAIEQHLSANAPGYVVDIGCNLGYMLHKFEDKGFDCIGIEIDETHLYILEKLRVAANKNFEIRSGNFLDDMEVTNHKFEIVVALNIFHHFLKKEDDYHKLIAFLERLDTNYMIFEPHLTNEVQMVSAHKNYPAEEFCSFVMNHSRLTKKEKIYQAHDGREIYILSR
jgi:2-polyprenyl-3-methyl-5-hydroxy-6-metoxy-1,4-benzoquinol methylase